MCPRPLRSAGRPVPGPGCPGLSGPRLSGGSDPSVFRQCPAICPPGPPGPPGMPGFKVRRPSSPQGTQQPGLTRGWRSWGHLGGPTGPESPGCCRKKGLTSHPAGGPCSVPVPVSLLDSAPRGVATRTGRHWERAGAGEAGVRPQLPSLARPCPLALASVSLQTSLWGRWGWAVTPRPHWLSGAHRLQRRSRRGRQGRREGDRGPQRGWPPGGVCPGSGGVGGQARAALAGGRAGAARARVGEGVLAASAAAQSKGLGPGSLDRPHLPGLTGPLPTEEGAVRVRLGTP